MSWVEFTIPRTIAPPGRFAAGSCLTSVGFFPDLGHLVPRFTIRLNEGPLVEPRMDICEPAKFPAHRACLGKIRSVALLGARTGR